MNIESAKYTKVDGVNKSIRVQEVNREGHLLLIPLVEENSDYIEIMRQVDAGELTIEPADE